MFRSKIFSKRIFKYQNRFPYFTPFRNQIPIIDVSALISLKSSVQERKNVGIAIHKASTHIGFFYIKGHGFSSNETDQILDLQTKFFNLPLNEKNKINMINSDTFRGYQNTGTNVTLGYRDWHEAIDLMRENSGPFVQNPLQGINQWPEHPENFKSTIMNYQNKMHNLGNNIMKGIALANNLPEHYFKTMFNDSFWVMRLISYPPRLHDIDNGIGCGEHTDYGFLTFVNQDHHKDCLQVRSSTGEWINANPIPGTFVVNIGDMMRIWSNGLYSSTLHRVQHPKTGVRQSNAYFYEPGFDVVIKPERKVNKNVNTDMKPIKYGNHLCSKVFTNFKFGPS